MAIIYCYGENKIGEGYAKSAAEVLTTAYPNHSWWVECKGGALVIKHFGISGLIGMVRHISSLDVSATTFKAEIIRAAGELLERANLRRGAYDGDEVKNFEADAKILKYWRRPFKIGVIH